MTWRNRLRLWAGTVMVVAVVAALTLVVNQRSRQAYTDQAQVVAENAAVGSAYGGVVVQQNVEQGDEVRTGQELFTLSSQDLRRDLANGLDPTSTRFLKIDAQRGRATFLAPMSGTVTALRAELGAYVAAGDVATVTAGGTQYVTAQFRLTPDEYGRLRIGADARVELPSRERMGGRVRDLAVKTVDGVAVTTIDVEVPRLQGESLTSLNQPGSPVQVTLTLADSGLLAGPTDELMTFLHRVGVR